MNHRSAKPLRRTPLFSQEYDGTTYRQVYRLDLRLLIPGVILTVISVPLLFWTWPIVSPVAVIAIGLALAVCAFFKRHRFSVSPDGYTLSWSIGPIVWTTTADSDEVEPILAGGRHGTYII